MIEIKFQKTHELAKLPEANNKGICTGDTGYDVSAVESVVIPAKGWAVVPVGLKVAYITPGYWFKVEGRSGLGFKKHIFPHAGIIDNPYRGDCGIKLYNFGTEDQTIAVGDRIAQFVVYPLIQVSTSWSETIDQTNRGEKGFGSSG